MERFRLFKQLCLFSALGALVIALGGCASTGGSDQPSTAYLVKTEKTAFYRFGPAQGTAPDLQLAKGDQVTLMGNGGAGYAQVMLAAGETGYVAMEDLEVAPEPEPVAYEDAPVYDNAEPAPLPEEVSSEAVPTFRY